MKQGVVIIAFNNGDIDYVKQAIYCAKRVKQHLNIEVQLVTDAVDYIQSAFPFYKKYIDYVTYQPAPLSADSKIFNDGLYSQKRLPWKNTARKDIYELSNFDKTLLIDSDLLLSNNNLLKCFNSKQNFMIASNYSLIKPYEESSFNRISDNSIQMYWATILYFEKSKEAQTIFELVKHIYDNYSYYRLVYNIAETKFRNDFAFSIAIHIMRGFVEDSSWPASIPSEMWVSTDKDILLEIDDNIFKFLAHRSWDYIPVKIKDATVHVMNKFSLNSFIDKEFANE